MTESQNSRAKRHARALFIYGGRCRKCKTSKLKLLQFHHKKGGMKEHYYAVIRRVLNAGEVLDDVSLLCANCHIEQNYDDGTVGKRKMDMVEHEYKKLIS